MNKTTDKSTGKHAAPTKAQRLANNGAKLLTMQGEADFNQLGLVLA